jgi:hypothetical protein
MGSTFKMGAGMNVQERLVACTTWTRRGGRPTLSSARAASSARATSSTRRDPDGFEVEIVRYATNQTYDTRMWQLIEHKASGVEQLRKGDNNLREIEDISGEAANASEMKAAASGNPLILEEVTLRTEIKRLEAEEYAWKRTRNTRQDRLARIADDARFIEKRNARLDALKAGILPKEPFSYTAPDGRAMTEKKDAGGPLIGAIATAIKSEGNRIAMGVYRGLHLYAKRGFGGITIETHIKGGDDYLDVTSYNKDEQFSGGGFFRAWITGSTASMSASEHGIAQLEREQKEADGIRSRLDEPFAKAAGARREARAAPARYQRPQGGQEVGGRGAGGRQAVARPGVRGGRGRPAPRRRARIHRSAVEVGNPRHADDVRAHHLYDRQKGRAVGASRSAGATARPCSCPTSACSPTSRAAVAARLPSARFWSTMAPA